MDKVARLAARERSELFTETATSRGMTPAIVEKDFWVTWVLERLFQHEELAQLLMFKGGTSLSKAYQLIERFSEDADLVLDWRVLEGEDPMASRSNTKQAALNKKINEQAQDYVGGPLLTMVTEALDGVCQCEVEKQDHHVINIRYPGAFDDEYLRPEVRLEIGPLASWLPYEEKAISCYAAEAYPDIFDKTVCSVRVIKAERTFWEKVTILHHEAHRPRGNPQPPRYSRHYYDLVKMASSDIKTVALENIELLANVVEFKQRFYPRAWARYDLAVPGTIRLVPEGDILSSVEADYRAMQNMIFGETPAFEVIMQTLQSLQNEING